MSDVDAFVCRIQKQNIASLMTPSATWLTTVLRLAAKQPRPKLRMVVAESLRCATQGCGHGAPRKQRNPVAVFPELPGPADEGVMPT
jgi:hypothetical protein